MPSGVYVRTEEHRKIHKRGCNTPEAKAHYSAAAKKKYGNPEERRKQSERQKEVQNRPEVKAKKSAAKRRRKDPEYIKKLCDAQKVAQNRPETLAKKIKNWFLLNGELKSWKEVYKELFEKQGNVCAICGNPETRKAPNSKGKKISNLSIDHNHKTGEVRGLLCHRCNAGLGQFRENVEFLLKAVEYLKEK